MGQSDPQEFRDRIAAIESLVESLSAIPDERVRSDARRLMEAVLDLHGATLERMLDITYEAGTSGRQIIDDMGRDELVGSLLLLHGLHPVGLEERVVGALAKVRPQLGHHGGDVELLGITDDARVRLRLAGNCNGCASSRVTLDHAIESAIYAAAPDVTGIDVEGAVEAVHTQPDFVSVEDVMSGLEPDTGNTARTLQSWTDADCLELFKDKSYGAVH